MVCVVLGGWNPVTTHHHLGYTLHHLKVIALLRLSLMGKVTIQKIAVQLAFNGTDQKAAQRKWDVWIEVTAWRCYWVDVHGPILLIFCIVVGKKLITRQSWWVNLQFKFPKSLLVSAGYRILEVPLPQNYSVLQQFKVKVTCRGVTMQKLIPGDFVAR